MQRFGDQHCSVGNSSALFVEFIALIYLSYLKKGMQENNLFKRYTMHEFLDELDVIECFESPRRDPLMGGSNKATSSTL